MSFLQKRIFDILVSFSVLIIFSPFLFFICSLIYFKLGTPVFFCQRRIGLNGKPFKLFKLRTMLDLKDSKNNLLPDNQRLTKFGSLIRSTSLDELPGLLNVLRGELSLVGPRPLLERYLPLYSSEQARRHNVLPGITGWAQVNGRNAISWEQKFKLDVWYVDNNSFWLDIKILYLTIKKVFIREGINADGEATMSFFEGNDKK